MKMPVVKAVLLIAGPQKGTRFRPLSLDVAKPLFPLAGKPILQHHCQALAKVPNIQEILILGFYPNSDMADFIAEMNAICKVSVRYLQEFTALGTAGGIYHFRDSILAGSPDAFFVMNGDVCGDLPLTELLTFHKEDAILTMMATEATREQSLNYGCVVVDKGNEGDANMLHYVEKPGKVLCIDVDQLWRVRLFQRDISPDEEAIRREAGFQTSKWWSQIKTAGSAIYANRQYLSLMCSEKSTKESCEIIGNVFIHPTANIHPTAVLGPNVSIGRYATVGAGTRIKESIILDHSTIGDNTLIAHTVTGLHTTVGSWNRIEGTPNDPNPNKPFAKMDNQPLFNAEGKLNPSITILGCRVVVPSEIVVLNSIVLPNKQISHSYKNEIIL